MSPYPLPSDDESFVARDTILNSLAIECLGFGIYSGIFWFTMHMLVFNRSAHQGPLRTSTFLTIIPLYILALIHLFVRWMVTRRAFVVDGASIFTILLSYYDQSPWCHGLSISTFSLMLLIADSVTAWRCWIVWNRNWKVALVPFSLVIIGLAFAITSAFYQLNPGTGFGTDQYYAYAKFNFVFLPVSLASTPISTALIVYRIVTITRETVPHLRSTYKMVIEIIVESAALYSAVLLIFIVFLVRDDFSDDYLQALLVPVTGITPTMISGRVALGKAKDYSTAQMNESVVLVANAATTTLSA